MHNTLDELSPAAQSMILALVWRFMKEDQLSYHGALVRYLDRLIDLLVMKEEAFCKLFLESMCDD